MSETYDYRMYLKAAYERVVSGKLSDSELCEEAIILYKGATRVKWHDGEQVLLWGHMVDKFMEMPHDCYCELIKTPTHMAAALLIYVWRNSSSARRFEPLMEAMELGLKGAIKGGFRGHGYDAEEDFLKNMHLYEKVNVIQFCKDYPDVCPDFTEEYVKRLKDLKEIVNYGKWEK